LIQTHLSNTTVLFFLYSYIPVPRLLANAHNFLLPVLFSFSSFDLPMGQVVAYAMDRAVRVMPECKLVMAVVLTVRFAAATYRHPIRLLLVHSLPLRLLTQTVSL
jgi:hypothetical protein